MDKSAPLKPAKTRSKRPRRSTPAQSKAPSKSAGLAGYQAKRDFARTPEPRAKVAGKPPAKQAQLFVIQKHAARNLHYDFRLEMEGVLRSWAVPKGPPWQKGQARLAMHVEDHPLEYARFEGTIPKGEYGGGTVMVWDIGAYRVRDADPAEAYSQGKIPLQLSGKKLKGDWVLVKTSRGGETKQSWLLIKTGADASPISSAQDDRSVLTGRSMQQIAADG